MWRLRAIPYVPAAMSAGVTDRWSPSADHFLEAVKHHSGVYRTGGSDGDVIVGTPDLAGSEEARITVFVIREIVLACGPSVCMRPAIHRACIPSDMPDCPERLNAVKITYLLLLFLNEIYWIVAGCDSYWRRRAEQTARAIDGWQNWAIRSGAVLVVLCDYRSGMSHDLPGVTQSGGTLFGLWGLLLCAYRRSV